MLASVDVSGEIRGALGTSLSLGLGAVMELCRVSSPFPLGIRDSLESVVVVSVWNQCCRSLSCDERISRKDFHQQDSGQRSSLWIGMVCGTLPSWHPLTKTIFPVAGEPCLKQ